MHIVYDVISRARLPYALSNDAIHSVDIRESGLAPVPALGVAAARPLSLLRAAQHSADQHTGG